MAASKVVFDASQVDPDTVTSAPDMPGQAQPAPQPAPQPAQQTAPEAPIAQPTVQSTSPTYPGTPNTGFGVSNNTQHQSQFPIGGTTTMSQQPTQPTEAKPQQSMGTQAPTGFSFTSLLGLVQQVSSLPEKGQRFFEDMKKTLQNNTATADVSFTKLTTPSNAVVLERRGKAVLLVPKETVNVSDITPVTTVFKKAMETYKTMTGSKAELLQPIVISPEDYDNCNQMTACISNMLVANTSPEFTTATLDSLLRAQHGEAQSSFVVSVAKDDVTKALNQLYPHATKPYWTYGAAVYLRGKSDNNNATKNYYEAGNQENVCIAVMTAYNETIAQSGVMDAAKFLPVVHISSMISVIPRFSMSALLLAMATDIFLRNGLYKVQYMPVSKEQPNIGKLLRDPSSGQLKFADNMGARDKILAENFLPPALALDIQFGTYNLPGLERFNVPDWTDSILEDYKHFLSLGDITKGNLTIGQSIHEYTGVIRMNGGQLVDSRCADYLSTMVHWEAESNLVAHLLYRTPDVVKRAELIRHFYPSFEVLYSNFIVPLNLEFMIYLQNLLRDRLQFALSGINSTNNYIDMSALATNGGFYQQNIGAGFGYSAGVTGTYQNPISTLYRPY